MKNSAYNTKNGRYAIGGQTEVSSRALEWWDRADIPLDSSDLVYALEEKYVGKPYLLGKLFYGDEGLWWVICQYNAIIDPIGELVVGRVLRIPSPSRVNDRLRKPGSTIGPIATTRGV